MTKISGECPIASLPPELKLQSLLQKVAVMLRQHRPVTESAVPQWRDEIERVYHDVKQTLRVNGVPLNFRAWAAWGEFFPAMWDAMRDNAETQTFEDAGSRLRVAGLEAATRLGKPDAVSRVTLGESEAFQIRAALDLYYYVDPKLLLFTCALRLALEGHVTGAFTMTMPTTVQPEKIERGIPRNMISMEMVEEEQAQNHLRGVFEDIKKTVGLERIQSEYRTLALWPDYLEAAWTALKPITQRPEYHREVDMIRDLGRQLATALPFPIGLTRQTIEELGADSDEVAEGIEKFERFLPALILNISLLQLDWKAMHFLEVSPFPAKLCQTRSVEVAA